MRLVVGAVRRWVRHALMITIAHSMLDARPSILRQGVALRLIANPMPIARLDRRVVIGVRVGACRAAGKVVRWTRIVRRMMAR